MGDRDTWQEIWGTIKKNKLRTGLTALGIFWGVFMLVLLLGLGNGLETGVFRNFGNGITNVMYVFTGRTDKPYKGLKPGRYVRLMIDDLYAVRQVPGVKDVIGYISRNDVRINYRTEGGDYEVKGEFPESLEMSGYAVEEGRYINQRDLDEARKVVVLGSRVKEELFGNQLATGKHVTIRGIDFTVVGVFTRIDIKEWNISDLEAAIIPIHTAYNTLGVQIDRLFNLAVRPEDNVRVASIEQPIRDLLKVRHTIAPDDQSAIGGFNLEEEFLQVKNLFFGIKSLLWFVGIGTLIAGIVGVSNIMLITVKERTKEIGIRKALGAPPSSIVSMILTESVSITALAGYMGLLLATGFIALINFIMTSQGIENQNFADPKVNVTVAVSALLFLIFSGALAGFIPALIASRVDPVIALKDE
jgi:putative ABC transport system permease protein